MEFMQIKKKKKKAAACLWKLSECCITALPISGSPGRPVRGATEEQLRCKKWWVKSNVTLIKALIHSALLPWMGYGKPGHMVYGHVLVAI